MPSPSRTITSHRDSLTLPGPDQASFTFFPNDGSMVKITVPPTSTWSMYYHWHDRAPLCEHMDFLTGGDMEMYRSLGPYRNSSVSGRAGAQWQNRPGERCAWGLNSHREHPQGSPDLEVVVRSQAGNNEEMWRNWASATIDMRLWPELGTTPAPVRWFLRGLRGLPLVGGWAWERAVRFALWVQMLLIFRRHEYWVWCGYVPVCWWWSARPWPQMAPQWAQDVEWKSSETITRLAMLVARALGRNLLGLSDGYSEYYVGDSSKSEKA